jgi:hypothetical protein
MANIVEMAILKDHGVNKTLHLKAGPLQLEQKQIVYIVRANIPNMYMVAEQIRSLPPGRPYEIHLVQVPRRSAYCERVLEEEGVCNDMSFGELDLGFIPVEQDVISMEDPEAFRQTKLMGDKTHLFYVARALMHLQIVTGIIRDIRGMGSDAKMVAEMMIKLRAELGMMDEEHECKSSSLQNAPTPCFPTRSSKQTGWRAPRREGARASRLGARSVSALAWTCHGGSGGASRWGSLLSGQSVPGVCLPGDRPVCRGLLGWFARRGAALRAGS